MSNALKIIDISWPISPDMTTYKDNKPVIFEFEKTFIADNVRDSKINFNVHTGTHVDAPTHFLKSGKNINQLTLDYFIGPCRVLDFTSLTNCITADDLVHHQPQAGERLLFKTKNSSLSATDPFKKDFVYLEKSGAQLLADMQVKTIGIDYLGIERNQPDHETHCLLFEAGAIIIEGIRLGDVEAGSYNLFCQPLLLKNLEAAPARAVLMPIM